MRRTRVRTIDCEKLRVRDLPDRVSQAVWIHRPAGLSLVRTASLTVELKRFNRSLGEISLIERPKAKGVERLFVCPISNRTCRVLYVHDERVGTPSALGIHYASQSQTAVRRAAIRRTETIEALNQSGLRIERRRRLVDRLAKAIRQIRWSEEEDPYDALILDDYREQLKPSRVRDRGRGAAPNSTRLALLEGRRSATAPTSVQIARSLDILAGMIGEADPGGAMDGEWKPASEFPLLDIRALKVGQGHAVGKTLIWPGGPETGPVRTRVRIDLDGGRLIVSIDQAGDRPGPVRVQVIALVEGSRTGDRFMVCPVSGTRKLQLYFRRGRFAGRVQQRLLTDRAARPSA